MKVTTPTATSKATSSAPRRSVSGAASARGQKLNRNGATSRTPIASPVHHTAHVWARLPADTDPESHSTRLPTEALIAIPASAPMMMIEAASRSRSSSSRKPVALIR